MLKALEKADVWAVFFFPSPSLSLLVCAYRLCNTIQHWVRIDLGLWFWGHHTPVTTTVRFQTVFAYLMYYIILKGIINIFSSQLLNGLEFNNYPLEGHNNHLSITQWPVNKLRLNHLPLVLAPEKNAAYCHPLPLNSKNLKSSDQLVMSANANSNQNVFLCKTAANLTWRSTTTSDEWLCHCSVLSAVAVLGIDAVAETVEMTWARKSYAVQMEES